MGEEKPQAGQTGHSVVPVGRAGREERGRSVKRISGEEQEERATDRGWTTQNGGTQGVNTVCVCVYEVGFQFHSSNLLRLGRDVCCCLTGMETTWRLAIVGGALLVSIIFIISLCLKCRRHHQPTSIPQHYSPDYSCGTSTVPSGFWIQGLRSGYQGNTFSPQTSHLLVSPQILHPGRGSCSPSDDGISQHSYDPPPSDPEYCNENDDSAKAVYIDVLPDSPVVDALRVKDRSRASSQSSGQNYQNLNDDDEESDNEQPYENVVSKGSDEEEDALALIHAYSSCSMESTGTDSADYVNAPK